MTGATAVAIGTAVAGAAASALISKALAPKPKAPAALAAPAALPQANDQLANQARKKSLLEQQARGGRAATFLSEPSDKLGG